MELDEFEDDDDDQNEDEDELVSMKSNQFVRIFTYVFLVIYHCVYFYHCS